MNRGTVKKIIWERKGLQKGRIRKLEGKGPNNITFFHSFCSEDDKVEKGKSYSYTFEVLDKDPALKEISYETKKVLKGLIKKKKRRRMKKWKIIRKMFKKMEKGLGKKVAVDLEP